MNRHKCIKMSKSLVTQRDKAELKKCGAKFVAYDLRPYYAVECPGFLEISAAVMRFGQRHPTATIDDLMEALPCRNTIRDGVQSLCEDIKKQIRHEINLAKSRKAVTIIIDNWTDNHKKKTYFGVIALLTIVEENGAITFRRYTLNMNTIEELKKTKTVIEIHLKAVFGDYGITEEDIKEERVTIVSDRGSNVKLGREYRQVFCYAHILNNIISHMLDLDEIKTMIKHASSLCSYVKNHDLNKFLDFSLKKYVPTRWNSVHTMFDSIIKNYVNIWLALNEKKIQNPESNALSYITPIKLEDLEAVANILKVFKEITMQIEGHKKQTLHIVWPAFLSIQKLLKPDTRSYEHPFGHVIEEMKTQGRLYIDSNAEVHPQDVHKIAVVLHPMMKEMFTVTQDDRDAAYRLVDCLVKKMSPDEPDEPVNVTKSKPEPFKSVSFLQEFCKMNNFENDEEFQQFVPLNAPMPIQVTAEMYCSYSIELQKYLTEPVNKTDDFNIVNYWRSKQNLYPNLFTIFIQHSCIPATSSTCESEFSRAGMVITNRRSCILPENVNDLMIARNGCD